MGGLAHFLEAAGIATTTVSLVREHTERMRPPRALWVPFPLGRPLGAAGEPAFQRRVLDAALALLAAPAGPVLEDFPEDAPPDPGPGIPEGMACPVSFPEAALDEADPGAAVAREVQSLVPWYQISLRARAGRTTVGAGGLDPPEAAAFLAGMLASGGEGAPAGAEVTLKHAIEDLKAFYVEAALVRPDRASLGDLNDWIWEGTALGRLLRALGERLADTPSRRLRTVARLSIVPRVRT